MLDLTFLKNRLPWPKHTFYNYDLEIFSNINQETTILSRSPKLFNNIIYLLQTIIYKVYAKINSKYFVIEKDPYKFDPSVFKTEKNLYISGYWGREKYFKDIKEVIRNDFSKFRYPLPNEALLLLDKIINSNSICLHFRRGDYMASPNAVSFLGNINPNYYDNAIKYMSEKISNPHLFVFSDDIEWCKKNFKSALPVTFIDYHCENKKFASDFQLMSNCKHYIIANSTFSWWAAWLGSYKEKIVVSPKKWIKTEEISSDEVVPEEWIKI